MKTFKRVLSTIITLIMVTSTICIASANTEAIEGQTYHIDISGQFNRDSIAKVGDDLSSTTWMDGAGYKYGFPADLFTATDGLVTFGGRAVDKIDPSGDLVTSNVDFITPYASDKQIFKIPQAGLAGGVNDNIYLTANEEITFNLNEEATNIDKIKIALHMYNDTSLSAKVTYTDGSTDTCDSNGYQANLRNADSNKKNWYIGNPFRRFSWKWTTSSIIIGEGGKATTDKTGGRDYYWGIAGYEIPVDRTKVPKTLTLKSNSNPIAIFALCEAQTLNADLQAVIDEVKTYDTGVAYTVSQIEKIELAVEYAEILAGRNALSGDDEAILLSISEKAQKQKAYSGINHIDISAKYDTDTIGTAGEEVGDSWLAGFTENGNFGGFYKSWFGTKEIFTAEIYNSSNVKIGTQEVYVPNVGRNGGENDAYALWNNKTLEVKLNEVYTKSISYLFHTPGASSTKAVAYYKDGTTSSFEISTGDFASAYWGTRNPQHAYLLANWKFLKKGNDNVLTSYDGTSGLFAYNIPLDETKIPDKVVFTGTSTSRPTMIYSVSQTPILTSEMTSAIETAKSLENATKAYTEEEISQIFLAKRFASILVSIGIGTASDYEFLDNLTVIAEKQKALIGTTHIDISAKYDTDTIGTAGDKVGDSWLAGYAGHGNYGGFPKSWFGTKELFNAEIKDSTMATIGYKEVYIPNVGRNGGENDAFAIWKDKTIEVKLNEVNTKSISYLYHCSDATITAEVYYKDGTKESKSIYSNNLASMFYSNRSTRVQYLWTNGTFLYKDANNTLTAEGSKTSGLLSEDIALDATKIPDKVVFTGASTTNPTMIYSVSQNPVTKDEMISALEAGLDMGVVTEDDEKTAQKLAGYKALLVDARIIASTDYANVESYAQQANAQKTSYVDLTEYLNADLMVKNGDTYTEAEQANLARTQELYYTSDSSAEMLTVVEPASGVYASDADRTEVGRTYKLSGAYNGKGNDVVKVLKDDRDPTTIALPKAPGKLGGIGVILDCNWANNQPHWSNELNAYVPEETTSGAKVKVKVNYKDNTSEEVDVTLVKSTAYKMSDYYANAGSRQRMDLENGTITAKSGGGMNSAYFYSSNIKFDNDKEVKSLEFKPNTTGDYNIIAISQFPVSNEELLTLAGDCTINEIGDITAANVDEAIAELGAYVELYKRGFGDIIFEGLDTEAEYSKRCEMLTYAKALKAGDLKFSAEISIADSADSTKKVATFNMINPTSSDQPYILVICAYAGNKLLDFCVSPTSGVVTAGATKDDTISIDKVSGATEYKAFVWESLTSLKPLGSN